MAGGVWPVAGDDPGDAVFDAAAAARAEWRDERELAAHDAFVAYRRARTFADHLREFMARGDAVQLDCGPFAARGAVVAVGGDLVAIRADGVPRIDVQLLADFPFVVRVVAVGAHGGRPASDSSAGFVARLIEHEYSGTPVRLWVHGVDDPLVGMIEIGADVVAVRSEVGPVAVVALSTVLAVQPEPSA